MLSYAEYGTTPVLMPSQVTHFSLILAPLTMFIFVHGVNTRHDATPVPMPNQATHFSLSLASMTQNVPRMSKFNY